MNKLLWITRYTAWNLSLEELLNEASEEGWNLFALYPDSGEDKDKWLYIGFKRDGDGD